MQIRERRLLIKMIRGIRAQLTDGPFLQYMEAKT